jgi:6-phosphogluconolactonase
MRAESLGVRIPPTMRILGISAAFFSIFAGLFLPSLQAQTQVKTSSPRRYIAYVGTYTAKTKSKGIYAYSFDATTGKLTPLNVAAEAVEPSFLALHPSGKYLYAVNGIEDFNGEKSGAVSAYTVDKKTGKLTLLNQVSSRGMDPCHVSLDKSGKYVFVANYTSGTITVFPVKGDGQLGNYTGFEQYTGTGPNKAHQEGPHAHWIETSPDNRFLLTADLGSDRIRVSRFHLPDGAFSKNQPDTSVNLKPGAGPRHAVFSPSGRFFYVTSELNSTVTAYSYDAEAGKLTEIQVVSSMPADFAGANDTAEIAIHPSGKFLYVSNRGRDSIAVFAVDATKGTLTPLADVATNGRTPRHFAIDPTGKYLFAENQESNTIVIFRINPATGGLTLTGQVVELPSPVDIAFLPIE